MPETSRTDAAAVHTRVPGAECPSIGNWTVVELVGAGTWSQVYRARPLGASDQSPSDYALKVARPSAAGLATAVRLLAREALVAQSLSHPHLTCVLSAHLRRPPHYLVLPFLEGVTLEAALAAAAPLPMPHAFWLARQTTEALHALHGQGWLHGDVKPSNILVSPTGHATLVDLSLARRADGSESGPGAAWAGTLAYAPPESYSCVTTPGPAGDIYSLGVTLYQMLTGVLPFPSDSAADLAEAHLRELPPDPRRFNPRLPPRAARLLRSLLAKQPDERPTAPDLAAWLAELEIDTFDERFAA